MKIKILVALLLVVVILLSSCGPVEQKPEHTHKFTDTYSNDATHHWYACDCGEKDGYEEHIWDAGQITIVPTPDADGIKTFKCIECGRKYSEKITYEEGGNTDIGTDDNGMSFYPSRFYKMDDYLPKTPLTLEAEIYVDPSITARCGAIFGNYVGTSIKDWLFEIHENGVPRFWYIDANGTIRDIYFREVDVRTGDWVHIAFTFDYLNGKMSVYLDGELAQSIAIPGDLISDITTYKFILGSDGRSGNGNYFKGRIRSLAAYSDVRTVAEIATSAANGINSNAEDILVHYELNTNSEYEDIKDLSPNGLDISKEWIDSHEPTIDYAYSFAVVGDTQWISRYNPTKLEGLYDWILANQESKKIAHVFGLGDITDAWNTADKENEWIRAYQYISKLDGVIPYSLVRGNHDESKYLFKYFANEAYMSQFDGFIAEGDIRNFYKTFRMGETDYLLIGLDYSASDEMLDWASEVVVSYPNHKVIVTTHAYQGYDGGHLNPNNVNDGGDTSAPGTDVDTSVNGGVPERNHNNGQQIWDKFVSKHPNIFLVLSGHIPMEDVFVLESEGIHGNTVTQMLINPQWMDPAKGGLGMVCMLYFSEDGSQMQVEWICTDTGKYYQEQNQFVIDFTDASQGTPHDFKNAYNEQSHHKACDCGYVYDEEPHTFDGGVLNAEGYMIFSCECGYQKVTSATDEPAALELQKLLEKYYNNGIYYREVVNGSGTVDTFFNGDKFFDADATELGATSSVISLNDFILGKYGDLKLDLGWNCYEGIYHSYNESAIAGVKLFAGASDSIDKVTVEEINYHVVIKLWSNNSVVATVNVGLYATTTFIVNHAELSITKYTKSNDDGICIVTSPSVDGYVAEYDYFILSTIHDNLNKTVYYSTVDVWDGKSVSSSLQGSGTAEDPFLIQSGADLAYVAKVVNEASAGTTNFNGQYFKMTKSIDLNGKELKIGGYTAGTEFHGYFDGNNCSIRGINATQSLFGMLKNGYIKNLSTYGTVTTTEKKGVAGLVSYMTGATVENITNYVNVTGIQQVAGVVGWLENNTTTFAKNCVNYGTVYATSYQIGGIAGFAKGTLADCTNFGDVTSTASGYVGGIGGAAKDAKGSRSNCVNYGNISAKSYIGGCFGQITATTTNCYSYGTVKLVSGSDANIGEVVGSGANYLTYTE